MALLAAGHSAAVDHRVLTLSSLSLARALTLPRSLPRSFPPSQTLGSTKSTAAEKATFATQSLEFNCRNATCRKLFPDLLKLSEERRTAAEGGAGGGGEGGGDGVGSNQGSSAEQSRGGGTGGDRAEHQAAYGGGQRNKAGATRLVVSAGLVLAVGMLVVNLILDG